jgi:hypothetical protein
MNNYLHRNKAVACLLGLLAYVGSFTANGAETPSDSHQPPRIEIERSRTSIAQMRSELVKRGASTELGGKVMELTRSSDLRSDEIELVVHYAVFCTDPHFGEFLIDSLIVNHDIKQFRLVDRSLVYRALRYFDNERMALVLDNLDELLVARLSAKVASLSDDDIRGEIAKFKESPSPDLRDRLLNYCSFLEPRRMQILVEINAALLEADPDEPELLVDRGQLDIFARDFIRAKQTLKKAWDNRCLNALMPYASMLIQTDDLPAADSLVDDLIRFQKWNDQIPKELVVFAFMLNKKDRYAATIDKILSTVDAADLKDEEVKQLHDKLIEGWKKRRGK